MSKPVKKTGQMKLVATPATGGPTFAAVKAILDRLVAGYDPGDLTAAHNEPKFGWATADQLRAVVVRPAGPSGPSFPLINYTAAELIAQQCGDKTNLIRALSPGGINPYGRMPYGGPYASPADLQTIVAWLNAGMPA
jgi:hypothetical protein